MVTCWVPQVKVKLEGQSVNRDACLRNIYTVHFFFFIIFQFFLPVKTDRDCGIKSKEYNMQKKVPC